MKKKMLMNGNEIIAESALRAGCKYYFGYPITPQTEISHYMAENIGRINGTFVQAESEISAINMLYGAASAGARCMTSSSSPGISLKQEGLSYMAGAELTGVVVNIVRCGPGLGGILPGQCDYFQAVKGGGHGDYRMVVFAPNSGQEMYELTVDAFNISDKYRIVAMIMGDGILGQMMETVEFRDQEPVFNSDKSWAVTGTMMKRNPNVITSVYIKPEILEAQNKKLQAKYTHIANTEVRYESINCDKADIIIVAYGSMSRVAKDVISLAKKEGIELGLFRPITLWPFPYSALNQLCKHAKEILTVELSAGQMVEDVRLAVNGKRPVRFYGRMGGMIPTSFEILEQVKNITKSISNV